MKELVIAEKPSVARDIARVLKCQKQLNGAMEGEKYIVTWGLGHLERWYYALCSKEHRYRQFCPRSICNVSYQYAKSDGYFSSIFLPDFFPNQSRFLL